MLILHQGQVQRSAEGCRENEKRDNWSVRLPAQFSRGLFQWCSKKIHTKCMFVELQVYFPLDMCANTSLLWIHFYHLYLISVVFLTLFVFEIVFCIVMQSIKQTKYVPLHCFLSWLRFCNLGTPNYILVHCSFVYV